MATLTSQERFDIRANTIREEAFNLSKIQLDAVVNAMDDWLEANIISFNTSIPQPQRGILTLKQKFRIFRLIIERRFNNG